MPHGLTLPVGRSHGCDDPPLATTRPVLTAPKCDPNASSAAIDVAVRAQAALGGPVYHINNSSVASLQPTIIITQVRHRSLAAPLPFDRRDATPTTPCTTQHAPRTAHRALLLRLLQDQCRICAVTKDDVDAICANMPSTRVVTVQPTTLDDVLGDVNTIANAMGVPARGERLVRHLRSRLAAVTEAVEGMHATRPKVVHLEWLDPLMGSGYWSVSYGCQHHHPTNHPTNPARPANPLPLLDHPTNPTNSVLGLRSAWRRPGVI